MLHEENFGKAYIQENLNQGGTVYILGGKALIPNTSIEIIFNIQ